MQSPELDIPCFAIPAKASSFAGFLDWQGSPGYPCAGRIDFCDGEVLVDMSPERVESHSLVKGEIYAVMKVWVEEHDLGLICPDGPRFSCEDVQLVAEPDAMFCSWDSVNSGRVAGGVETDDPLGFRGAVDWVLEVVSPSSVTKDRTRLFEKYFEAGVREYWIVDARGDDPSLQVFVIDDLRYRAVVVCDGWQESPVFGLAVKLTRTEHRHGRHRFRLTTK